MDDLPAPLALLIAVGLALATLAAAPQLLATADALARGTTLHITTGPGLPGPRWPTDPNAAPAVVQSAPDAPAPAPAPVAPPRSGPLPCPVGWHPNAAGSGCVP